MSDKKDFIASFSTEHYTIYCDEAEVDTITCGHWASLSNVFERAKEKVAAQLKDGRKISTGYICTKKNKIMFWTYKPNEWWTL